MVAPEPGAVVLVRFPFSDAGRGDWILCQVNLRHLEQGNAEGFQGIPYS